MLYVLPDYYPQFHCTADQCEETCCAGWQIVIDPSALRKYKKMKGPYRRKLRASIDWKESCFKQDSERRCAHLRDDGLCELIIRCGPESLCRTCRLFPRHIEEFENVREVSLELSCPEACRIILERTEPVRYLEFERDGELQEENYRDYDDMFYSQLEYAREVLLKIAQDRSKTIEVRTALMAGASLDLQHRYNVRQLFSFDEVLEKAQSAAGEHRAVQALRAASSLEHKWGKELFWELRKMEFLHTSWPVWLAEAEELLFCRTTESAGDGIQKKIDDRRSEFYRYLAGSGRDWSVPFEQILVYFLFSDYCGSVYDGRIFETAQTIAAHMYLLREMFFAVWMRNEGTADMTDLEDLTVRYCREIGHSDENRKHLEKYLSLHPLPVLSWKK